ncbi:MAG TPA: response regulator [Rhizomicrobium sp.]|nr:response regulator [Rhizomicrobium sp.]
MAKILTVEDEPLVRMLIVQALEDAGHSVLEAPDGEAALLLVNDTPELDLVVSDVRMPRLGGYQLAQAVRQLRPKTLFLFMTGYSKEQLPEDLKGAKIMQKPFDPDELVANVERLLGKETRKP